MFPFVGNCAFEMRHFDYSKKIKKRFSLNKNIKQTTGKMEFNSVKNATIDVWMFFKINQINLRCNIVSLQYLCDFLIHG